MKDLYTNLIFIKEDIHKCKDIPCLSNGRLNVVKMSALPKAIYRYNVILITIPMAFLREIQMGSQGTPNILKR